MNRRAKKKRSVMSKIARGLVTVCILALLVGIALPCIAQTSSDRRDRATLKRLSKLGSVPWFEFAGYDGDVVSAMLSSPKITDLRPLDGLHLNELVLRSAELDTLDGVSKLPLKHLWVVESKIGDVSALRRARGIQTILLPRLDIAGIDDLRSLPNLEWIGTNNGDVFRPKEFWQIRSGNEPFAKDITRVSFVTPLSKEMLVERCIQGYSAFGLFFERDIEAIILEMRMQDCPEGRVSYYNRLIQKLPWGSIKLSSGSKPGLSSSMHVIYVVALSASGDDDGRSVPMRVSLGPDMGIIQTARGYAYFSTKELEESGDALSKARILDSDDFENAVTFITRGGGDRKKVGVSLRPVKKVLISEVSQASTDRLKVAGVVSGMEDGSLSAYEAETPSWSPDAYVYCLHSDGSVSILETFQDNRVTVRTQGE